MRSIQAEPFALDFEPVTTALIIIDMQRDFVMPGGFGEMLAPESTGYRINVRDRSEVH